MKGVQARPFSPWGCPGIYWEGLAEVGAGRAERKSFEIMLMGPHLNAHIDGLQRHSSYFMQVLESSSWPSAHYKYP